MTNPLNLPLFLALQDQFEEVRIVNPGQPRVAHQVPATGRPGRFIEKADQRGEQYSVCCPFCREDRFRLFISYRYGEQDAAGNRNFGLWCCHNEKCHESETNRKIFRGKAAIPVSRRHALKTTPAAPVTPSPRPVPQEIILPEGLTPIGDLPDTHPAVAYLIERGFDPGHLQDVWGVSFCSWCQECSPSATNRIIIPAYKPAKMFTAPSEHQQPVLAGWQARLVTGLDSPCPDAKYLCAKGMQKSELLYGLPLAIQTTGPVYLVEGATDCWRIGPGAVALFGKVMSRTQKLLLVHHFAGRPIVVLLDPDAREAAQKIQRELQLARGSRGECRVVLVDLPPGIEDPGACPQEEIFAAATGFLGQPAAPQPTSRQMEQVTS